MHKFYGKILTFLKLRFFASRQPSLHGRITTVFLIFFIVFIAISSSTLLIVFNYQMGRYTEFVGSQYAVQLGKVLEVYYNRKNSWENVGDWLYRNFASEKGGQAYHLRKGRWPNNKGPMDFFREPNIFLSGNTPGLLPMHHKSSRAKDLEMFFFHKPQFGNISFYQNNFLPAPNFQFHFWVKPGNENLVVSDKMLDKEYLESALLSFCLVDPFCSFEEASTLFEGTHYAEQAQFNMWFENSLGIKENEVDEESLQEFLQEKSLTGWTDSENRPELFANEQSESFLARLPLGYIRGQDRYRQMFVLLDTECEPITSNLPKEAFIKELGPTWDRLKKYVSRYKPGQGRPKAERSFFGLGKNLANHVFPIKDQSGETVGFLYAESIVSPVWKTINREVNSVILKVVLFSSLIIALLYWFIGRYYLSKLFVPLRSLSHIAGEVGRGNTRARMEQLPKEAELALVTEQFNKMLDSLAHGEKLREQQCRDVAHELRTPITIISGELQLIEEGVYLADEKKIKGLLSQVQQMQRLVDDLDILYNVDGSKSKEHSLDFVELDVTELLCQAHSVFRTQMQQKGIHFTLGLNFGSNPGEKAVCVQGNASRLHQVFSNFLVNAMRYTPKGGHIEIAGSLLQDRPEGEYVVFSVEDNGCGIPEEKRKFVFERFSRVEDDRNHQSGGSGLGLAISKSFIELHNGIIWVEEGKSAEAHIGGRKGAKFCFALRRV